MTRNRFCRLFPFLTLSAVAPRAVAEERTVVVHPREYQGALRNPLKGFRPNPPFVRRHPYACLTRWYVKWNEIEDTRAAGVDRVRAFSNQLWKGVESDNVKVIPRVYLEWPKVGRYWPSDLTTGDYSSPEFKRRLVGLIEKIGTAWDNDPRVAFVEMGMIGLWGEHHDPKPDAELQKLMGNAFLANFRNKLVMRRYAADFTEFNFGVHWDSFGHKEEMGYHLAGLEAPVMKDRWKTAPMGGEAAFNWGTPLGKDPTDAVAHNSDAIVALIRRLHWNHLGWISDYDQSNRDAVTNGALIQKALGYRFVIDEFSCTAQVQPSGRFEASFLVRNTGSSPFYYRWPIELSLLDLSTRKPVWKSLFAQADIRTWMPGGSATRVSAVFDCPPIVQPGRYITALAILDPAGNKPGARFAVENYYLGGRHPMTHINVGVRPDSVPVSGFDNPAVDRSLAYAN